MYSMSTRGDVVVWRNGEGKTFKERILCGSNSELVTQTIGGASAGKRWVYFPLGSNRIQLIPNKDKPFIIEKRL